MPTDPLENRILTEMPAEYVKVVPSTCPPSKLLKLGADLQAQLVDWFASRECHPAVRGYGFGVRWVNGQPTDQPLIRVFVAKNIDPAEALPEKLFPTLFRDIAVLDVTRPDWRDIAIRSDAPVDLSVGGEVKALSLADTVPLRQKQRPARGGSSIGHPDITGGTLGMRVRDVNDPARALVLSNCHVLAKNVLRPELNAPTIQPATADLGSSTRDVIGRLVAAQKLRLGFNPMNYMDAAIAELNDPRAVDEGLAILGRIPTWRALSDLPIGTRVAKIGRTSGLTFGVVKAIGVSYKIDYGLGEPLIFANQILTSHVAGGGDSGSILVALGPVPSVVGLVLAGSLDVTLASPIEDIHKKFGITTAPTQWAAPQAAEIAQVRA
jgi:hypothetical protein